jgi:hypothetical protein
VSAAKNLPLPADRRESTGQAALVAAYCEGLGLTPIAVIRKTANRVYISAGGNRADSLPAPGDKIEAIWWCRRSADAARVADAATARLQRCESKHGASNLSAPTSFDSPGNISAALQRADKAIAAAARQCNVTLYTDEETLAAAKAMIARVDEEIGRLRQTGELRSVNRSYRSYRTEAVVRGESAMPYIKWLNKYKANLLRQLAATLRYS